SSGINRTSGFCWGDWIWSFSVVGGMGIVSISAYETVASIAQYRCVRKYFQVQQNGAPEPKARRGRSGAAGDAPREAPLGNERLRRLGSTKPRGGRCARGDQRRSGRPPL